MRTDRDDGHRLLSYREALAKCLYYEQRCTELSWGQIEWTLRNDFRAQADREAGCTEPREPSFAHETVHDHPNEA